MTLATKQKWLGTKLRTNNGTEKDTEEIGQGSLRPVADALHPARAPADTDKGGFGAQVCNESQPERETAY